MKPTLLIFFLSILCSCSSLKERKQALLPQHILSKAAHWQMDNFSYREEGNLHDYGINSWTNAVLYMGMTQWAKASEDSTVWNWLMDIGEKSQWEIAANFKDYPKYQRYHADELCVAQFYLSMFAEFGDSAMLASPLQRADWIMSHPQDSSMKHSNKQSWTWCDALFMAPPVYAQISQTTGNNKYLAYMDEHFKHTYQYLYDHEENLFFRDDSYFEKMEANGEKIFWGRGNGWVAAGLANILKTLPEDYPQTAFYEQVFVELMTKLAKLQSADGFWHASLLDPASYPSPETSATALITYALAYGINSKLLPRKDFLEPALRGWNALLSVVDENGKLGFVQPIGADPKAVTQEMTAVYGVGAFLMAGCEIMEIRK